MNENTRRSESTGGKRRKLFRSFLRLRPVIKERLKSQWVDCRSSDGFFVTNNVIAHMPMIFSSRFDACHCVNVIRRWVERFSLIFHNRKTFTCEWMRSTWWVEAAVELFPHRRTLILTRVRDVWLIEINYQHIPCRINYLFSKVSSEKMFELMKCDGREKRATSVCFVSVENHSLLLVLKSRGWLKVSGNDEHNFSLTRSIHTTIFSLLIKQFRLLERR